MGYYETSSISLEKEEIITKFIEENFNKGIEKVDIDISENWEIEEVVLIVHYVTDEQAELLRELELRLDEEMK